MSITRGQLTTLCSTFHKFFRIGEGKGFDKMWNAINNLDDEKYGQAMRESLAEIGIEIRD